MIRFALFFTLVLSFNSFDANAAEPASWLVRQVREGSTIRIEAVEPSSRALNEESLVLRSQPSMIVEGPFGTLPRSLRPDEIYEEILYRPDALPAGARALARQGRARAQWAGSEVRTLVHQGPPANRIDLTIVGDGYTEAEKDRFFEDAQRLTDDLFGESTFKNYLPLFNVHAVFVPSRESGITDTKRRDTALGLYRDPPNSKRAVMVGNTMAAERAIALAPGADYPILVANDDYYGGLGGRFAVTTRSVQSGKVVLRHELGHNFGNVGEEYDGGYVYSGANNSRTTGAQLKWKHWADANSRTHESRFLAGEYLWKSLAGSPIRVGFNFPAPTSKGRYLFDVQISSVGWASPDDVHILLDGEKRSYNGIFTPDRSFFKLDENPALEAGRHELVFRENVADGDNMLAFAMVYAHAPDYDFTPDQIGAYPVFNSSGYAAGYRPTHDSCLMRDMLSPKFCAPDLENMWIRFLDRVSLIDSVTAGPDRVALGVPPLEGLEIRWYRLSGGAESELTELRGLLDWVPAPDQRGNFRVRVRFQTPEVRKPTDRFQASRDFRI